MNGRNINKIVRLASRRRAERSAPRPELEVQLSVKPPQSTFLRVLLADSETVFRLGLKRLLESEGDMEVVGQTANPLELVPLAAEAAADVAFVQAEPLGEQLEQAIAEARRAAPACRFVLVASTFPDERAVAAVRAGASGVILKSTDPALFIRCARKVHEDEVWLPKKQVGEMARMLQDASLATRPADTLTPREKVIIAYLTHGWRNREIARSLSITEQTVKNHLRNVYDKIGVSDRVELVLYALHKHLDLPRVDLAQPVAS